MIVETDPHTWLFSAHAIKRARERLGAGCTLPVIRQWVSDAPDESWEHVGGCLNATWDRAVMVTSHIPGVKFVIERRPRDRHSVVTICPYLVKRWNPKRATRARQRARMDNRRRMDE